MRRRFYALLCALASVCVTAHGQAFLTVGSSNLMDASHTPVQSANVCAAPVDAMGNPASILVSGVGVTVTTPVCTIATNGVWSMSLPDTKVTQPGNACFSFTATDLLTGASLIGPGYSCVQPSSTAPNYANGVYSFDKLPPMIKPGTLTVFAGPKGAKGDPGTASVVNSSGTAQSFTVGLANGQVAPGAQLSATVLNGGYYNASLYPGTDIGQQINAAIAAAMQAGTGGWVYVPPGNYYQTTSVTVPHGIAVVGFYDATTLLNATASGVQFYLSNPDDGNQEYKHGFLENLHLRGTQATGQYGIYLGGDYTCTGSCTTNPSTNIGFNYHIKNVVSYGQDDGIYLGNGAFNYSVVESHFNNNKEYGMWYPPTSTKGGQFATWIHSQFQGNPLGAWHIGQPAQVAMQMSDMDIQYNTGTGGPTPLAELGGGNVLCTGCHIEHSYGPLLYATANDSLTLVGGTMIITGAVTSNSTEPYLVRVEAAGRVSIRDTLIFSTHDITRLASVVDPKNGALSVFGTTLLAVGHYFGGVTDATGPNIRYENPIDPTTQVPNLSGQRYWGGISNFDTSIAGLAGATGNQPATTGLAPGAYIRWNPDGSSGAAQFLNMYNGVSDGSKAIVFSVNNGGTITDLGYFTRNGSLAVVNLVSAKGFVASGSSGVTGTCTGLPVVTGGIVTGCTGAQ